MHIFACNEAIIRIVYAVQIAASPSIDYIPKESVYPKLTVQKVQILINRPVATEKDNKILSF